MPDDLYDLIVIGGGPAGFFGALTVAADAPGSRIVILEKSRQFLSKVLVSGGGRCNVTQHNFEPAELVKAYPRGAKELLGPLHRFGPKEVVHWFEQRRVRLKTEADGRVFPISDSSSTIVQALLDEAVRLKIELRLQSQVTGIQQTSAGTFEITLREGQIIRSHRLLLATGGERKVYALVEALGHTLIPPVPSLFTFNIRDDRLAGLAGVSVANAVLRLDGTRLQAEGPVLVTHWGLSGPAVLRLSAWGARELAESGYHRELSINWLGERNQEQLNLRLEAHKEQHARQQIVSHSPDGRIPQRLWRRLAEAAGAGEGQPWAEASRKFMGSLASELVDGRFTIHGKGAFKEEFVTCGGVNLKEVDFRSMESRVCLGLYLAGELLDIDALTGGYNFQNAWTTGWIAGKAIAGSLKKD
jgi:predicted Rossmann fold flavoprotein